MRIRIHRGTKEIGGTCIEIESAGKRIALDVGLPLDAPEDGHERLLPAVPGFREADDSLLGVLISHPHQDHYGLARYLRPEVPVYIGEAAHRILRAASKYVPNGHAFTDPRFIADRTPLDIGPFRVTPYLVDHSAFDAHGLLVEADGRRVYYSGDFRAHGRKARLFEAMVADPPPNLDVLLMEGTTIGRTGTDEGFATETDLENEFVRAFRETPGLHFVWASGQNIDRIVTVFRAAKRSGRVLLLDLYTAVLLEATGRASIPQSHWEDVRVYIPYAQTPLHQGERPLRRPLTASCPSRLSGAPAGAEGSGGHAVPAHDDPRPGVQAVLDGARLSYSMWQGYLREDYTKGIVEMLEEYGVRWEVIHTSGHASVPRLAAFRTGDGTADARANTLVRRRSGSGVLRERRAEGRWGLVGGLGRFYEHLQMHTRRYITRGAHSTRSSWPLP